MCLLYTLRQHIYCLSLSWLRIVQLYACAGYMAILLTLIVYYCCMALRLICSLRRIKQLTQLRWQIKQQAKLLEQQLVQLERK
ncbi:CG13723 [Drosophila busckii]|uniref:CG13723 n=2 Tax=Drosophila busckii TaxID=30019 RepID=A0A0M4EFY7_DROBS|nr:CG13723 [Drosophila busckii]